MWKNIVYMSVMCALPLTPAQARPFETKTREQAKMECGAVSGNRSYHFLSGSVSDVKTGDHLVMNGKNQPEQYDILRFTLNEAGSAPVKAYTIYNAEALSRIAFESGVTYGMCASKEKNDTGGVSIHAGTIVILSD